MKDESNEANIKRLSDDQLLASAENQFAIERKTSHFILLHLKEISVRRVYAKRGFPDLREMLIKHFKQSETAANQRIKSLQLMLDVPAVEERLISGDLNMSTVAMAQRQIKLEEKLTGRIVSKEKKAEIVESITNKTMAKAEIELFKLLPETASHPQTHERRVSEHATRLNLTVPNDVMEMLIRLKEIWAHVDPRMDHVQVIRRSLKMTLQKVDPAHKARLESEQIRVSARDAKAKLQAEAKNTNTSETEYKNKNVNINEEENGITAEVKDILANPVQKTQAHVTETNPSTIQPTAHPATQSLTDSVKHRGTKRPTYYRKALDRALWRRANCQCEFTDETTGRRCPSRFGLQREHVIPLALSGTNDLSNMQLLCFTHNQLRARNIFGDRKIDSYQQR